MHDFSSTLFGAFLWLLAGSFLWAGSQGLGRDRANCNDGFIGACREAAKAVDLSTQRGPMAAACQDGEFGTCMTLAYAELSAHDETGAKRLFVDVCDKAPDPSQLKFGLACEEAEKLMIPLPLDASAYADAESLCQHWKGEEPYNAQRAKEIRNGVAENCRDRSLELKRLRDKYKEDPDVLFRLSHLP